MGGLGRRCIRLATSGMFALLVLFVACGGQGATQTPMVTAVPVQPALSPTVQATPTVALSPDPQLHPPCHCGSDSYCSNHARSNHSRPHCFASISESDT